MSTVETEHRGQSNEPVHRVAETAVTAGLGAILGGFSLGLASIVIHRGRRQQLAFRLPVFWGFIIGAMSGLLTGWRQIYDWRTRRGRRAFVADHTWALATTGAGALVGGVNVVFGATVEESLSRRQNRLVFARGLVVRPGFALSVGYVVSGAADRLGVVTARRRQLVTAHEDIHIWQARRWGPLYPVLYGLWMVGGFFFGLWRWWTQRSSGQSVMTHIDAAAYYSNPFEWRAYTEDNNWPPATADPTLVWTDRFSEPLLRGWRGSQAGRR